MSRFQCIGLQKLRTNLLGTTYFDHKVQEGTALSTDIQPVQLPLFSVKLLLTIYVLQPFCHRTTNGTSNNIYSLWIIHVYSLSLAYRSKNSSKGFKRAVLFSCEPAVTLKNLAKTNKTTSTIMNVNLPHTVLQFQRILYGDQAPHRHTRTTTDRKFLQPRRLSFAFAEVFE